MSDICKDSVDNQISIHQGNLGDEIANNYDKLLLERMWPLRVRCHICQISRTFHEIKSKEIDHPFIKDNLDYLSWKYKQSLQSNPKGDIITFNGTNDTELHQ